MERLQEKLNMDAETLRETLMAFKCLNLMARSKMAQAEKGESLSDLGGIQKQE